jgi:hypothetical protein
MKKKGGDVREHGVEVLARLGVRREVAEDHFQDVVLGEGVDGGGSVDLKGNAFACARDGGRHKKHANEWRGNRASAGTGGGESRRTGRSSTVVLFCFRSLTRRRVLFTCGATS